MVLPGVFRAAKITELLHCAEPFFSKKFIGFKYSEPKILSGRVFFLFAINFAPNCSNGLIILLKSRLDRLLSPIIFNSYGDLINKPSKSLANVPELPAFMTIFFLYSNPLSPLPYIKHILFLK